METGRCRDARGDFDVPKKICLQFIFNRRSVDHEVEMRIVECTMEASQRNDEDPSEFPQFLIGRLAERRVMRERSYPSFEWEP